MSGIGTHNSLIAQVVANPTTIHTKFTMNEYEKGLELSNNELANIMKVLDKLT
jgi:hypothetical protein